VQNILLKKNKRSLEPKSCFAHNSNKNVRLVLKFKVEVCRDSIYENELELRFVDSKPNCQNLAKYIFLENNIVLFTNNLVHDVIWIGRMVGR
jgi:hypothetical protein